MTSLAPAGRYSDWQPAPVQLVVSDLDGTFLGTTETPSTTVTDAAAALVAAGIRFSFATGRLPAGLPDLAELAAGPHIVHNGAQVVEQSPAGHATTFSLAPEQATLLAAVCRRYDVYAEFYTEAGFYVTSRDPLADGAWELMMGSPIGIVTDEVIAATTILKATIADYTGVHTPALMVEIAAIGLAGEESTAPALPDAVFINATAPGVSKGATLRWLCDRLGIPLAAVAAIGDGRNDSSMFQIVGTAIAMGSAPDDVVALAHFVAPDVFDDGAAVAMRALLEARADDAA
ncbi:Cof subfamily protein (haloacid dehalogenase superfamily) [Conyzicola lurida]|uniref:Cof subfamily protein (Haloacid dehalogenase superfamily) n=1 Tax=Conyzicola lurida TaxID=1172621 RepID=A0A841API8_9MICO|nr:Cof subfamily protein (haloacid dehalogenase superfamily) [Conyzicola lurida]